MNDQKQSTYWELFRYELEPDESIKSEKSRMEILHWGTKRFQDEISIMVGRHAFPGIAGRLRTKIVKNVVCPLLCPY